MDVCPEVVCEFKGANAQDPSLQAVYGAVSFITRDEVINQHTDRFGCHLKLTHAVVVHMLSALSTQSGTKQVYLSEHMSIHSLFVST